MRLESVMRNFHLTVLLFFMACNAWAQTPVVQEETEEGAISQVEKDVVEKKKSRVINSSIDISSAFDTNTQLSGNRKGDFYQKILYSASMVHNTTDDNFISLSYDVNALQYNEFTDTSNLLNHLRVGYYSAWTESIVFGVGVDESFVYFPNNKTGAFNFHKVFSSLKHQITPSSYHQLQLEGGLKDYARSKAFAQTSSTYQDKNRRDMRRSIEYSVTHRINKQLKIRLKGKSTNNDGNANFQDYYDYRSYDLGPKLTYQFNSRWTFSTALKYSLKKYKNRLSRTESKEQKDQTFSADIGANYAISKANSIGLGYAYSNAISNNGSSEYSNNTIKLSFQHDF